MCASFIVGPLGVVFIMVFNTIDLGIRKAPARSAGAFLQDWILSNLADLDCVRALRALTDFKSHFITFT
jgi:hypothetical protein